MLREIRRELPFEDLLYVADSGHAPYGDKPRKQIESRSFAIAEFLLERGAKALVIACNTATGAAARQMRPRLDVPLIAMEPAVKPAVARTRTGVVGVLVTSDVKPLLERGTDTLVLGCTHYPHLRSLIQDVAGAEVSVLDSGAGVARQVRRRLGDEGLLNDADSISGPRPSSGPDRTG